MKKALGCLGWLIVISVVISVVIPLLVIAAPLALVVSIFAWWHFNKKGNEKYTTVAKLSTIISVLGTVFFIYSVNTSDVQEEGVESNNIVEQVELEESEIIEEEPEEVVEDTDVEEPVEVVEEESVENPEKVEAEESEEIEETEVEEKSELISNEDEGVVSPELALSLMESSFEGIANVTYSSEDKAFLIEPTDQEIKTAVILLQEGSTPEINASWEYLKDSFVSASNSIKDNVGAGYQIHLLNPMNNENTLLIIIDGVVIYDAFSQ